FVDVAGSNARIGERILRHPYDQAFNGLGIKLAEGGVREADDTGGHCRGSWKVPDRDGIHIGTLRGAVIQARNCTCAASRAVANPPSSSPTPDFRTDFPLSNKVEFRPLRLIGLALAASCLLGAPAQAGPYLLVDYSSGRVIAESDAGVPWHPASVTKLMTTYLAFQAMRERRAEPLTLLKVSENAMA